MSKYFDLTDIKKIKPNPDNPRVIKDEAYKKLVKSIQDFPQMLELRPIVIDEAGVILGGNMRYRACIDAGMKKVPTVQANTLTEQQKREFIIKDNLGFGEWDWEILKNDWDNKDLSEWGLDLSFNDSDESSNTNALVANPYTQNLNTPTYEVKGDKPLLTECYNDEKFEELKRNIENSSISADLQQFLLYAAQRHVVFNYEKIADLYAHSDATIQKLFEESALVIIDFDNAIKNGFVKLSKEIQKIRNADNNE